MPRAGVARVLIVPASRAGNPFVEVPGAIRQASLDALAVGLYAPKVLAEPKLMPYVCESGAVRSYCST
jgi:hypothetical protein